MDENFILQQQISKLKRYQNQIGLPTNQSLPQIQENDKITNQVRIDDDFQKLSQQKNIEKISLSFQTDFLKITAFSNSNKGEIPQNKQKPYKILKKIGEGFQGSIYLGIILSSNLQCAIKKIRSDDREIINQAKNEFKILKTLNHSNIIKVYKFYEKKMPFQLIILMEYLDSQKFIPFTQMINQLQQMQSSQQALSIFKKIIYQIFETISYIHFKQIVHRDINPSNILVHLENYSIKIIDFGLAKSIQIINSFKSSKKSIKQLQNSKNSFKIADNSKKSLKISQNSLSSQLSINSLEFKEKESLKYYPPEFQMLTPPGNPNYRPPIQNSLYYNEKCDVWQVGLLLLHFQTTDPVTTQTAFHIVKNFSKTSPTAFQDLCFKCLQLDQEDRISSLDALTHAWFK